MDRKDFERLVAEMEPDIRDAFIEAVQRFNTDIPIKELEAALEAGDTQRVMELIEVKRGDFSLLDIALTVALAKGAQAAAAYIRRVARQQGVGGITFAIDMIDPRATEWLRDRSFRFDEQINEHQREIVREALARITSEGRAPASVARDLVGRINRTTGRREGGQLGLTSRQSEYADNALAELRSGDKAKLRAYLKRKMRDRGSDSLVKTAIREGKPVPADKAQAMVERYRNRLLYRRGELIAKHEARAALHEARDRARQALIDSGKVRSITKTWHSRFLPTTRHSHAEMDGTTARQGELFRGILAYPGDSTHGAPPDETIGCVCHLTEKIVFA